MCVNLLYMLSILVHLMVMIMMMMMIQIDDGAVFRGV